MTNRKPPLALRNLGVLFGVGAVGGMTDGHLLDQFSRGHREAAEAAFATLVERHGPMVLRVCRGVLGDSHDVHDAFQATFLVLVRKAGSLWVRDSIGPWLHSVAFRIATKVKVAASRRKAHERRVAEVARVSAPDDDAQALHQEIERLPKKYRAPVVLCYLEGLTHDSAAIALGWPVGTVRGRLARARDLLRARLVRRGLAPSAAALGAWLSAAEASASLLPESLVRSLSSLVAERSAGVAPAAVVALAEGVLRMMSLMKWKVAAILLLTAGLAAIGLARAARPTPPVVAQDERLVPISGPASVPSPAGETWPAGAEVSGRVIDSLGNPVAGADILLLGKEKLTVYANLGGDGRPNYSLSTQPDPQPSTVKTDADGQFKFRGPAAPSNRLAVVSPKILLWEVTRRSLDKPTNLLIRLPEPVGLTIRSEIPDKPAKLEFWAVGRLLDQVDRDQDSVYYRNLEVPNPGELAVPALPPAQYAIDRINLIAMGNSEHMMTPSERRIVSIEPGKKVDLRYDRKVGRRIEGRVTGLGDAKFRYAHVTINYLGPEEYLGPGPKKSRMYTGFDAIPLGPDGRFTTPPLPPNRYDVWLSAMLAATPKEDGQTFDFQGQATIDVPEAGKLPALEIVAKRAKAAPTGPIDAKKPRLEVGAFDEAGNSIRDFEARLYGPPNSSPQAIGVDGIAVMGSGALRDWHAGELIVTAPGFAPDFREFGAVEELRKLDVVLKRGTKVLLRVRDRQGRPIPPALMPLPLIYLAKNRRDAWMILANPYPDWKAPQVETANLLKVRREPNGDFAFWIQTNQPEPLYFGFSHPDLLKCWETGPIPASQLAGGTWDVVLPEPTTLDISLQGPPDAAGLPPFGKGFYSLTPVIAGQADAVPVLESGSLEAPGWRAKLGKLAPGTYNLNIQTIPRENSNPPQDGSARIGQFYDRRTFELKSGVPGVVTFEAPRFNPDAWKGTRSAVVVVQPAGNRPVAGEEYRLSYVLANYGTVPVATGKLGDDGKIVLERIAASGSNPSGGDYWVEVGGESLGKFRVEGESARSEVSFRMPLRAGDRIANVRAEDLESGRTVALDGFGGRVVFLEFWATWCGPCREPMDRLVALDKKRGEASRKDLALVAIGIDNDRAVLQRQSRQYGAPGVQFLWSPADGSTLGSDAHARFSIFAVPTAFLIGKDGKIAWRGHPLSIDVEKKIDELRSEGR